MHRFEVWAPFARHVSVEAGGFQYVMEGPDDRDSWSCQVEDAGPGTDYGFLLDGGHTPRLSF